jgi:AAA domain/Protein tyrosine and serine/threonine kinase
MRDILRGRYRLANRLEMPTLPEGEAWVARGEFDTEYLAKVWPFAGPKPDDVRRSLWDAELRTLYRIGSSPGAETSLLVLRDAGVDDSANAFVMILEAPGYSPLSSLLANRAATPWLAATNPDRRRLLWTALRRLADGLALLHDQHVLHRNVSAENVFLSTALGPESVRLGGFEWSIRLGSPAATAPPTGWSSPPEFALDVVAYRPETDWFAFGMLAARCLLDVERHSALGVVERHRAVIREVERTRALTEVERALLFNLLAPDPTARLARGYEVAESIDGVAASLSRVAGVAAEGSQLVMVFHPNDLSVADAAQVAGWTPDPADVTQGYNPRDPVHVASLVSFLRRDLSQARVFGLRQEGVYLVVGAALVLRLAPFNEKAEDGSERQSWDLAWCRGAVELRNSEGASGPTALPRESVEVRTVKDVYRDRTIRQRARSWESYLPVPDRSEALRASLSRFLDFIRCTNQLELLLRDAEIFAFEVAERTRTQTVDRVRIREVPRSRLIPPFARVEGGMSGFFLRELETGKRYADLVVLTDSTEDGLFTRSIPRDEMWRIVDIDATTPATVLLERQSLNNDLPPAPESGFVRTFGMFGQVSLIRRRKLAIDRLSRHSYLLRSIAVPGQVFMDTGQSSVPVALPEDAVDVAKRACIEDILRVRPIYALQGPPGTGKTTLVAWLLREVFADDPVAQVLVTAQAHGAVDVLREKVEADVFASVGESSRPLSVRLRSLNPEDEDPGEGSVEQVALGVLERSIERLSGYDELSELQREWLAAASEMASVIRDGGVGASAPDFCELVKRGASITYCTTSAGALEALADGAQSFDWSILEEAGKAHGFDLALPLQAGHRWLLIGDHQQLPPYRYTDYHNALDHLTESVQSLWALPDRAGGLLDQEWLLSWQALTPELREEFRAYAKSWLNVFRTVHAQCEAAPAGRSSPQKTLDVANGSAAGLLSGQHRMHPDIGELISRAYYDGQLVNRTLRDGQPVPGVVHAFAEPAGVDGRAIVWVDLPWASVDERFGELGPERGKARYTNTEEARALRLFLERLGPRPPHESPLELAVLSPYNQQVALLRRVLDGVQLVDGLTPRRLRRSRPGLAADMTHSVDAFQGNQADVVAVSLVRNNLSAPEHGLGFLKESSRINVLLSRAERLLVLVGSWEFFLGQVSLVELDDVGHTLWHWKQALMVLDDYFSSGRALRLPLSALESA